MACQRDGAYRDVANRKKLKGFAESRGWEFSKEDAQLLRDYPYMTPLDLGSKSTAKNVMQFTEGNVPGQSFDFISTTVEHNDGEKSQSKNKYHVVGLHLAHPLPHLALRRRNRLDRVRDRVARPVEFAREDFNGAWSVECEHPPAAIEMIHPGLMDWFMNMEEKQVAISVEDDRIFTWRRGRQRPEHVDPMIALLTDFLGQIPAPVWEKSQGTYPREPRQRGAINVNHMLRAAGEHYSKD